MKRALFLLILVIPLLGFWLASSLAVYFNGPMWLAIGAGLFFFPILPLAWDAWSNVRRRKSAAPPKRRLTNLGRIMMRVLVVNLLLIGGLLAFYPQGSFKALSTRGDWMLEGRTGTIANGTRTALFFTADRLEWLYLLAKKPEPITEQTADVIPAPPP